MSTFPCIELTGLLEIADHPDSIEWQPFAEGVVIHRLYGNGVNGPTAALIRFEREARVPMHLHTGWEHILVLSGSQTDQNGTVQKGTLRIHPPGTCHSIISEAGCIVLAIYEKPVSFLEARD